MARQSKQSTLPKGSALSPAPPALKEGPPPTASKKRSSDSSDNDRRSKSPKLDGKESKPQPVRPSSVPPRNTSADKWRSLSPPAMPSPWRSTRLQELRKREIRAETTIAASKLALKLHKTLVERDDLVLMEQKLDAAQIDLNEQRTEFSHVGRVINIAKSNPNVQGKTAKVNVSENGTASPHNASEKVGSEDKHEGQQINTLQTQVVALEEKTTRLERIVRDCNKARRDWKAKAEKYEKQLSEVLNDVKASEQQQQEENDLRTPAKLLEFLHQELDEYLKQGTTLELASRLDHRVVQDPETILRSIFSVTEAIQIKTGKVQGCPSSLYSASTWNITKAAAQFSQDVRTDGVYIHCAAARPRRVLYLPALYNIYEKKKTEKELAEEAIRESKMTKSEKWAETNSAIEGSNASGHWVLVRVEIPPTTGQDEPNTIQAPEAVIYDSAPAFLKGKGLGSLVRWSLSMAEHMQWYQGAGEAARINVLAPVAVPCSQQMNKTACGLHVIFNAWAHALGLSLDPDVRCTNDFYIEGGLVANMAMEGRASWKHIAALLVGHGYVMANTTVSLERRFSNSVPIRTIQMLDRMYRMANFEEQQQRSRLKDVMDPGLFRQKTYEKEDANATSVGTMKEFLLLSGEELDGDEDEQTIRTLYQMLMEDMKKGEQSLHT